MLEAFALTERITGTAMRWEYDERAREGDHICYYSDLRAMRADYPEWSITKDLPTIVEEIAASWQRRGQAR